jgi:formate hydrogenlyase subunit 3/multisubunit Na+/H+ antiporter MnhD subunit
VKKKTRKRIVIVGVLAVIALVSWLIPYDYRGCGGMPTPPFGCFFRNAGLSFVRALSTVTLLLVLAILCRREDKAQ